MKKITKYNNGLTLVYYEMPDVRSAAIGVFVKTGSVNENAKNNGISHFVEHTMFKGTKKRSAFDIVAETDGMGAAINAYTSKTATCYYIQCVDSDFEKSADILSDIFFDSVFPDEELEREKGVILEEIAMCNDTPDDLSYEIATTAFYKGHALSRPILGTKSNVSGFSRDDILKYVGERYTSDNVVISVAGHVCFDKVYDVIGNKFALKFGNAVCGKNKIPLPATQSSYVKKFKKIEQGNVNVLFPSVSYDEPLFNATRIFNSVFGYGMSSRLYQNIRERSGLAYSVYSYLSPYEFTGHSMIYIGTNVANVEKALVAVSSEIDEVRKNGITEEEFSRGKAQIKSGLVFGLESSVGVMNLLGKHAVRTGELADIDALVADIDAVTSADVAEAIAVNFKKENATVGYVGPKIDKNLLDILKNQ
ncbi:MAG: pitrilysin family protein [Eubacteriales bacterium]|nr:pitrilysin family protein [Christensenellaceae bacterium]MDY2751077.1 pitrilysin family protein [Eubacteriales bacterium]